MKLRPHGPTGRVIVKRDADAEATDSGIAIPVMWQRHRQTGTVVAVHSGAPLSNGRRRLCEVMPGDRVLFGKYSGTDFVHEGELLTVMPESELMAVIE